MGEIVRQRFLDLRVEMASVELRLAREHNDWVKLVGVEEAQRIFAQFGEPDAGMFDLEMFEARLDGAIHNAEGQ